jgi:hypothetical protein
VMLRRADEPMPSKLSDYVGTSYSHRQQLRDDTNAGGFVR